MGAATQMVKVETEIEVPTKSLMRVLVIDDETQVTESWQRLFEGFGFFVKAAAGPEEALDYLRNEQYDVVVSDIMFEDTTITGDQLITENPNLMGEASVVAITAYGEDQIKRLDQLRRMGVSVLEKGKGNDELQKIVVHKLEERRKKFAAFAEESLHAIIEKTLASMQAGRISDSVTIPPATISGEAYLLTEIKSLLVDWFRSRKNAERRAIVYAGRTFSPNELAAEVEKGTEIGVEHLETMVDLFKDCLNLK